MQGISFCGNDCGEFIEIFVCLKRGWDFAISLRGIRASRSGCSDHRSGHLWFRCSLPLVWCHGVGHLDSGAVAFFTVDHVICVWSVNCCSFSCGIACSSVKMQRTQFMGQDERYSDTSVVAQKVSDTSISRDEFEVFLCTICYWKDPNKEAGDFGDPAGLGQYNEEFRNKERFFLGVLLCAS